MTPSADALVESVLVQPATDAVGVRSAAPSLLVPRTIRVLKGYAFTEKKTYNL